MTFNNIINHLVLWCSNKAETYEKTYGKCGGITYIGCQLAYELKFKVLTFIDKPVESLEILKREILDYINI